MAPEPDSASNSLPRGEINFRSSHHGYISGDKQQESFDLYGTSVVLIGLTIALAAVGVPITVVLTDRSLEGVKTAPTLLKSDGSQTPLPLSLPRIGQLSGRDPSGKQEQVRIFR